MSCVQNLMLDSHKLYFSETCGLLNGNKAMEWSNWWVSPYPMGTGTISECVTMDKVQHVSTQSVVLHSFIIY
jgi:hypothetical protein